MLIVKTKPIEVTIDSLVELFEDTKEVLTQVGLFASQTIAQRTARGVDWKGTRFKNYSSDYADERRKKQLPVQNVDLFFSGHMMGAIKTSVKGDTARLYFASAREKEKAARHNVGDGVPARHFFDLTPNDIEEAQNIITEWFENGVE